MNQTDMDNMALGALAESLVSRIEAQVADPDNRHEQWRIVADRIELFEGLRRVIQTARRLGLLGETAPLVGGIAELKSFRDKKNGKNDGPAETA